MTTTEPATVDHERLLTEVAATTAGMTALLAWHAEHPDLPLVQSGSAWIVADHRIDEPDPAEIVRTIADGARIGDVTKTAGISSPEILFIERDFGGSVKVSYQANREQVCERVVTGTETVEVPDPDAPKVSIEREVVEWRCESILAGVDA